MKTPKVTKLVAAVVAASLAAFGLAGCAGGSSTGGNASANTAGSASEADNVIKVGANPTPHAEILNVVKDTLAEEGYTLEIVEYNDYVMPNTALEEGELDANYFQHITYLNDFNEENGTHLASAAGIHFEPFGLYSNQYESIADIPDGATVTVPNDTTNEARALLLLQQEGLITLKDGVGLTATVVDIEDNPKNLQIKEVEAAQVPRTLDEVALAAINGNFALNAGIDVASAIAVESNTGEAAEAYVNVIAVLEGTQDEPKIQALVNAVQSDAVKQFIDETYNGAVITLFDVE